MVISQSEYIELLAKLDNIAQTSGWEIAGVFATAASSFIALILALVSVYKSSKISWLKIQKVQSLPCADKNNEKIDNLGLSIDLKITPEIPIRIKNAYIIFGDYMGIGYKLRSQDENLICGKLFFEQTRTYGLNDEKLYEVIDAKEFYNKELKKFVAEKGLSIIKKGKIVLFTSAGPYKKTLNKEELGSFINSFEQIIKQEKTKEKTMSGEIGVCD